MLARAAEAAQCGTGPGGFAAWQSAFADEAKAKGIGAAGISALMETHYNYPTIAADRGLKSFRLSLPAFMAKRGASIIASRGRRMKQAHAELFDSIEAKYGVPAGPLIAIWGMESASAPSTAISNRSRPSRRSPMIAGGRTFSPISFMRR